MCELATVCAGMGSKVSLIGRSVLAKMAKEAGEMVEEGIAKLGLDVKMVWR